MCVCVYDIVCVSMCSCVLNSLCVLLRFQSVPSQVAGTAWTQAWWRFLLSMGKRKTTSSVYSSRTYNNQTTAGEFATRFGLNYTAPGDNTEGEDHVCPAQRGGSSTSGPFHRCGVCDSREALASKDDSSDASGPICISSASGQDSGDESSSGSSFVNDDDDVPEFNMDGIIMKFGKRSRAAGLPKHRPCTPHFDRDEYDRSLWDVTAKIGGHYRIINNKTSAEYSVPKSRINKALKILDTRHVSQSLVPARKNCACAKKSL